MFGVITVMPTVKLQGYPVSNSSLIRASTEFCEGVTMPFLPLFIVIGIFLATSKILQPSDQNHLRPVSDDYDQKLLNQALIDYIAHESRNKASFKDSDKTNGKFAKTSSKGTSRG